MVDRTYDAVVGSGRYSLEAFMRQFDALVGAGAAPRPRSAGSPRPRARGRRPLLRRLELAAFRTYRALLVLLAALRLIGRRRPLRRLALAWARSRKARAAVPLSRLLDDLFKLALVLDAQAGRLAVGKPFRVQSRYDAGRERLTFGSRPAVGSDAQPPDGEVARSAIARSLERASLQEIVWNHAAVGDAVWAPSLRGLEFPVEVGYHAMNGVHSFRALVLLGPRFPDLVLAALEPLLTSTAEAAPEPVR
jgi:hypothetical protein